MEKETTSLTAVEGTEPELIKRGVQCASEFFVPGGSNFIKGDLMNGAVHAALGMVAKAYFGPVGLMAVIADSISKSQTGKYLYEQVLPAPEQSNKPAKTTPEVALLQDIAKRLEALENKINP